MDEKKKEILDLVKKLYKLMTDKELTDTRRGSLHIVMGCGRIIVTSTYNDIKELQVKYGEEVIEL